MVQGRAQRRVLPSLPLFSNYASNWKMKKNKNHTFCFSSLRNPEGSGFFLKPGPATAFQELYTPPHSGSNHALR